jgi:hypothetical protein
VNTLRNQKLEDRRITIDTAKVQRGLALNREKAVKHVGRTIVY